MKITVIGCGRWGSLITWYLDRMGHDVTLYGMADAPEMQRFLETRSNDLLSLPESVHLTTDITDVTHAETIIISIPSQALSGLMGELKPLQLRDKTVVLCMKGIEISTGRRLSEIATEALDESCPVAVWLGPGHVQEFYKGNPSCMVIDSQNNEIKHRLVDAFSSDLIRFYYGQDMIGNEVGAAAKNVIGIAAGMLDGFALSTLKGALMARGTHEVARLIEAMGGNSLSAYGLCHLGDYETTLFSEFSNNRKFGEELYKGVKFDKLAEGVYTAKAMMVLAEKYKVELPITKAVYNIVYENHDPLAELLALFGRKNVAEFN
jgi:glycerol-3-phosphate dehydrogenase (NAD(P)+)